MFRHRLSGTMLRTRGIQPLQPHTLQQVVGLQGQGAPSIAEKNTEFLVTKRGWRVFRLYVLFFLLKPPIVGKLLDYQRANKQEPLYLSKPWNDSNSVEFLEIDDSTWRANQRTWGKPAKNAYFQWTQWPWQVISPELVDSRWTKPAIAGVPNGSPGQMIATLQALTDHSPTRFSENRTMACPSGTPTEGSILSNLLAVKVSKNQVDRLHFIGTLTP